MNLRAWLRAARPLAHGNIAPPILLGEAMACDGHSLDLTLLLCTHLFGVLDHLVIVFANDFADEETDRKNANATPFSGGSRVLVRGELEARDLGRAALAVSASFAHVFVHRRCVLLAALFAPLRARRPRVAACLQLRALRLSYRGGGELLQGIGIGVVLPSLGFYMQRGSLEGLSRWALLALFIFGVAGNLLTALPDTASDRESHKHTWSVLFGELHARRSAILMAASGLLLLAFALHQRASETMLAMLVPFVALLMALRWLPDGNASHRKALLLFSSAPPAR